MHEVACPSCDSPSAYDLRDYLLMCQFCSSTFRVDLETGQKEVYSEHYIVPNAADGKRIKETILEWMRRMHHKPGAVDKEFFITNIAGMSIPYWVVSLEAHTIWKGLAKKHRASRLDNTPGSDFLVEKGQFRRSYRWAISARANLFETWGTFNLHEPGETSIQSDWDGFPLDSTLSRGQTQMLSEEQTAYDDREFFQFKYANGLPILGVQVEEEEALRRAKSHVNNYHTQLAKLNVDHLVDMRTELEIAGIQLIHLPFWFVSYVYRPQTFLRHIVRPKERHVIVEGHFTGILRGELAVIKRDKLWINSIVSASAALLTFLLGAIWHPSFFLVSLFCLIVAGASSYIASVRDAQKDSVQLASENTLGNIKISGSGSVVESAARNSGQVA